MRFIGNKANIIEQIHTILSELRVSGDSFCDFFSGTTSVARFYKNLGYSVISSDILYLSFCLQKAYIENNEIPQFKMLLPHIINRSNSLFSTPLELVIEHLNSIDGTEGFIYSNYTPDGSSNLEKPRMYYTGANGKKIDSIRIQIEHWHSNGFLSQNEYYILLACIIETVPFYANISGVYAAFHKKWDARALKPLILRPIKILNNCRPNFAYNINSIELCCSIDVDILYIDPPYNERQYAPNYHLLETIAKYDNPVIKGITGMRDYIGQKSNFCNPITAITELDYIAKTAKYKYLVLSYNSDGIMDSNAIISTLGKYGKVILKQFKYNRFKSNNFASSNNNKFVYEQIYILFSNEK